MGMIDKLQNHHFPLQQVDTRLIHPSLYTDRPTDGIDDKFTPLLH